MCCSSSKFCQGLVPNALQVLVRSEIPTALQGPGQHHLGPMFCTDLNGHSSFCRNSDVRAVHMYFRSTGFQGDRKPLQIEGLIPRLQQELGLGR